MRELNQIGSPPSTYRQSQEKTGLPLAAKNTILAIFFMLLLFIGFYSTTLHDSSVLDSISSLPKKSVSNSAAATIEFPLTCPVAGENLTSCPVDYFPSKHSGEKTPASQRTCPDYFRFIHQDLWAWREIGITKTMVEMASRTASFRLVIVNGRAYVETFVKAFQTRDTFTLWGILQLLRRYPGQIPDLEIMFDCVDWPVVRKEDYLCRNASTYPNSPPPLFRYCSDNASYDIVFPDWSYWGWAEINIKPWEKLSKDLREGNKMIKWKEREPYAYWKGNPQVAESRMDLLKCNFTDNKRDWGARIYIQDWDKEYKEGYKQSDLAKQCNYRYKIYIEGSAWSVSEKYILACDSVPLIVNPRYHDFFSRSLMPLHHYWPISADDKCRSIKHAVDWGNRNADKAQAMGRAASNFILDEVNMDHVYDYMFHLLSEYAKLLTYKPSVPPNATELYSEMMACSAGRLTKKFMMESMVRAPSSEPPCGLPPPYDSAAFHAILDRRVRSIKQADDWKNQYWDEKKHV